MSWIYDLTRRPRRNFGYRFDAAMFVGREPTTISTYFFRELRDRDRDVLFFLGPRVYSSVEPRAAFPLHSTFVLARPSIPELRDLKVSRKQRQGGGASGRFRLARALSRPRFLSRFLYLGVVSRPHRHPLLHSPSR